MEKSKFNHLVEAKLILIKKMLVSKGDEYASDADVFRNFNNATRLSFHSSREKLAWEYMVKHLQSIKDIINKYDNGLLVTNEMLEEKFTDAINYLILIESMLKERNGE